MFKFIVYIIILASLICKPINGQVFNKPFYASKSPETLELLRVVMSPQATTLYFTLENRITGGYFCTDRRTYLIYPNGKKSRMIKASGIPYCPELHKFYLVGEKLHFELIFPPLPPETKWVDLVEQCGGNCYWIYGIVLDDELNKKLYELFKAAEVAGPEENINLFRRFLDEAGVRNHGIEGMIYYNLINASLDAGDKVEAMIWYNRLNRSDVPRKEEYIKMLNEKGIKF